MNASPAKVSDAWPYLVDQNRYSLHVMLEIDWKSLTYDHEGVLDNGCGTVKCRYNSVKNLGWYCTRYFTDSSRIWIQTWNSQQSPLVITDEVLSVCCGDIGHHLSRYNGTARCIEFATNSCHVTPWTWTNEWGTYSLTHIRINVSAGVSVLMVSCYRKILIVILGPRLLAWFTVNLLMDR